MRLAVRTLLAMLAGVVWVAHGQNNAVYWSSFTSGYAAARAGNAAMQTAVLPLAGRGVAGGQQVLSGFLAHPGLRGPVSGIEGDVPDLPFRFALNQNFPNPFNPETVVSYQLSAVSNVKLTVYDLLGRVVATLVDGTLPAGAHKATWNASGFPSGVYFYRLESGGMVETRKMVLMR